MDPLLENKIIESMKRRLSSDSSGHDIHHTLRVFRLSKAICAKEGGDLTIVTLASLLHDADDRKLFPEDSDDCKFAVSVMKENFIDSQIIEKVVNIIKEIPFKASDTVTPSTLEGKIVQDADRLDAIGAIGIARAFAYGGSKGRMMHNPDVLPKSNMDAESYYSNEGTTINHFHEKLFLLKDLMNTKTGKLMAEERHKFMVLFIDKFKNEWEGKE